jgi:hypothetical protein
MNQEIQLYSKINDPMAAIAEMGRFFAKSTMFGCDTTEQGMVVAMTCMTEQMSPMQFQRKFHLIGGRPSMRSDAMLGEFRLRGGKHRIVTRTADEAKGEFLSPGETAWVSFAFTWAEAQLEPFIKHKGAVKDKWATPRSRKEMLWMRVISDAVHTLMPEIVAGVYTPEELADDAPTSASPGLDLGKGKKPGEKVSAKPQDGNVIDVESELVPPVAAPAPVKDPEPKTATAQAPAAPAAATAPQTAKATIIVAVADPKGGIDAATQTALMATIPEADQAGALTKLVKLGWLKEGAALSTLSAQHAQRIFGNVQGFLNQCRKG